MNRKDKRQLKEIIKIFGTIVIVIFVVLAFSYVWDFIFWILHNLFSVFKS